MGKSLTVKIGGASGVAAGPVCRDIAGLVAEGWRVAVVHGGSHEVDAFAERCGMAVRTLTSPSGYQSRYTDAAMLDLVVAAIAGSVNAGIVQHLFRAGVRALGLSGLDAQLVRARRKPALRMRDGGRIRVVRDDFSGRIEHVDADVLHTIFAAGWTPVIAPPSMTDEAEIVNVDADRVAAAVAVALASEALVILSNVPGILADPADPATLVRHLRGKEIADWEGRVKGRMKTKVAAARGALAGGVGSVVIADSRMDEPLRQALARRQGTWLEAA